MHPVDADSLTAPGPTTVDGWAGPEVDRAPVRWALTFPNLAGQPLQFWVVQLYVFFALSSIDEEYEFVGVFRPRLVLGVLGLILSIGTMMSTERGARMVRLRPSQWLIFYAAACLISAFWSYDFVGSMEEMRNHTPTILMFFLLIVNVRTKKQFAITVLVMAFGAGLFLALSNYEWFCGRRSYSQGVVRMQGIGLTFKHPNALAGSIVYALPVLTWVAIYTRTHWIRACALLYWGLSLYGVLKTSSRTGFIALILAVIAALFMVPAGKPRKLCLTVLVAVGVLFAAVMSPSQRQRIATLVSPGTYAADSYETTDGSTQGRIESVKVAWAIFLDHPFLGIGPGAWRKYRMEKVDGSGLHPHNLYGELLATRGILGTFAFAGFVASMFGLGLRERRRLRRDGRPEALAAASLVGACLFVFFLLGVQGLAGASVARAQWYIFGALMIAGLAILGESTFESPSPEA